VPWQSKKECVVGQPTRVATVEHWGVDPELVNGFGLGLSRQRPDLGAFDGLITAVWVG
jgi:hypothetical protein